MRHKEKEMSKLPLSMLKHDQIDNPDQKVLVQTIKKQELSNLGYDVSTKHGLQGKQAPHIVVVRFSIFNEEIYNSKPHCLVAITRHTKTFQCISAYQEDQLRKL